MNKKEKFNVILPIGLAPKDVIRVKDELETALKAKCTIENDGNKITIYISRGSIPKKINYITPRLDSDGLLIPIGFSHEGLQLLDMASDSHCYMLCGGNPWNRQKQLLKSNNPFYIGLLQSRTGTNDSNRFKAGR